MGETEGANTSQLSPPSQEEGETRMPLPRYGLQWNGPEEPVPTEMEDGYWTPWHLANEAITKLQREVDVQAYWGPRWEAEYRRVKELRELLAAIKGWDESQAAKEGKYAIPDILRTRMQDALGE